MTLDDNYRHCNLDCPDPSCPVCGWDVLPVKLSPQRNVTYGWEGLDDEYVVFSHPNGPVEPGVIIKDELVQP